MVGVGDLVDDVSETQSGPIDMENNPYFLRQGFNIGQLFGRSVFIKNLVKMSTLRFDAVSRC